MLDSKSDRNESLAFDNGQEPRCLILWRVLLKYTMVFLSSSHSLSVKDIQESLSYLLYRSILFPFVYIPYHALQGTIERFPDSNLADRVGHLSHGNMLAVQGRI